VVGLLEAGVRHDQPAALGPPTFAGFSSFSLARGTLLVVEQMLVTWLEG
jgi:hypothetical protein